MVKKSEVHKVVDKTFVACKSARVKKLCVRVAKSYAGLFMWKQVAERLFKIFSEHGPPDRAQSDNGGEFKKYVKKVSCSHSFLLLRSRFYHYC